MHLNHSFIQHNLQAYSFRIHFIDIWRKWFYRRPNSNYDCRTTFNYIDKIMRKNEYNFDFVAANI